MRDVNNGWLVRYLHANTASAFFFLVYLHIGRNLYYGSYKAPRTLAFAIGVIILIAMIVTGFLGYTYSPTWYTLNHYPIYNKKSNINLIRNYSIAKIVYNKSEKLNKFLSENKLSPIYCYEDLHLESTKNKIKTEVSNLSGIYLILNKETLDYYIGSASTNRFYIRFSNHLIHFHGSKIVKLAVKTYGLTQFAFIILELFPEIVNKENNKKLLDLEDFYLKSLLPNYNILTEAGSNFGYKHTEITRINMKLYNIERREKIGNLNKVKPLRDETKEKLKKQGLIRTNRCYNKQGIINMKNKYKSVVLYNKNYTVYGEFSSITDVAKSVGCSVKTITRSLKTEKKILKRRWFVNYK